MTIDIKGMNLEYARVYGKEYKEHPIVDSRFSRVTVNKGCHIQEKDLKQHLHFYLSPLCLKEGYVEELLKL